VSTIRQGLDKEKALINDSNSDPDPFSVTSNLSTSSDESTFIPLSRVGGPRSRA
jgi:hypothetical protein